MEVLKLIFQFKGEMRAKLKDGGCLISSFNVVFRVLNCIY